MGARGAGGFTAMMLGSVSRYVATWAPCPVVVVREESAAVHSEIAVGVRDPEAATGALTFAFEEAALRGADLFVVHTWYWLPPAPGEASAPSSTTPTVRSPSSLRETEQVIPVTRGLGAKVPRLPGERP